MFAAKNEFFSPQQGYQISRSARFRNSAGAYITRPFATPTNSSKWTMSMWVKRGILSSSTIPALFGKTVSSVANFYLAFNSSDTLTWTFSNTNQMVTSAVFRDPSAWYHIVVQWNTTTGTAANRVLLYVNGSQVTSFSTQTTASSSEQSEWNKAQANEIGRYAFNGTLYTDSYMAEVYFVDGQALTPSSFGAFDSTGVWQPLPYTGTYGTNGFYLNFSDNSSNTATTIGKDYSGNGNNWTPNNISVTSGATYDSMTDVPTLTSATAANYCVLNPLNKSSLQTISDGNLGIASSGTTGGTLSTLAVSSGKYYWEYTAISLYTTNGYFAGGIATENYYPQNQASNDYGPGGPNSSGVSGVGTGALYYPADTGIQLKVNGSTSSFAD